MATRDVAVPCKYGTIPYIPRNKADKFDYFYLGLSLTFAVTVHWQNLM